MNSQGSGTYEVYALHYASRSTMASQKFYRYELYGEPDKQYDTAYYFWLIRDDVRTVLVDCGFSTRSASTRNRAVETDPVELLGRMGVAPADVDHVVLSHMHFDHIGNIDLFPNATFTMARSEFEFWTGSFSDRPCIEWQVQQDEVDAVVELERAGRMNLVASDTTEIFPGIDVAVFPGHTPGQLVTSVASGEKTVVLASDAVHFYDELSEDRPFQIFLDLVAMYDSLERLREIEERPFTEVIPGHDPNVMSRYVHAAAGCADLLRPQT
ncbi:N-acyl homoserine lactonase family protein [Corynebacterium glyciniphilum]|uniref:N-acyl homoserine lactonase family protein n=1 Tax=Corynebacterium glyciniphilum TaxID=1404244 RepID=UPI003DA1B07C